MRTASQQHSEPLARQGDFERWNKAKHLLNRAGFGGRPDEIATLAKASSGADVDRFFLAQTFRLEEPEWLTEYDRHTLFRVRQMSREERRELARMARQHIRQLQLDWLQRMIETRSPSEMLWEKMTFFWHSHFATSVRKVKLPPLIFQQLSLLHSFALGNFRELLHGISRDPAMLRYLDNNQNRKGKPNENFARELLELFSLGPGHYTEHDVKEAARAFAGWSSDPLNFRVRPRHQDRGTKTFLGRTGRFDGKDIVNIILEQPACAEFITEKLLAFLGFETASDEFKREAASRFRESDYELEPLLRSIFEESEFYTEEVIGNQIKSPIQLLVGALRTLQATSENNRFYLQALEMMGQVPYLPPNVKGWPGGRQWIDTSRLLTRYTFAEIVSRGEIPAELDPRSASDRRQKQTQRRTRTAKPRRMIANPRIEFDPFRILLPTDSIPQAVGGLERLLLAHPLTENERQTLIANFSHEINTLGKEITFKRLLGDIMTLPAFQLC